MTLVAARRPLVLARSPTPSDLPGLVLWLDADRIQGLADAAAIGTWSDLSGLANDYAQATASLKPLYKAAIINGRPIVRFDGADDALTRADDADFAFGTGDFTIAVVFSTSDTDGWLIQKNPSSGWGIYIGPASNQPLVTVGAQFAITGTALNDGKPTIVVTGRLGSACEAWRNGRSEGTFTSSNTVSTITTSSVGDNGLGGGFLAGDIGEIIVLNTGPTVDVRNFLRDYTRRKWGINVL